MPPEAISKRPARSLRASVKAPLTWPNSSLSNRVFAQGAHVDVDEDLAGALRAAVDLARRQLLSGTVLAENEDAGVGGGHLGDRAENLLQYRCLADDVGERPVEVR